MEDILLETIEASRLDLLDRQEFVDRMLTIAEALSDNKKNACYAVNGDWGVGKSFVLDMFEEQAKKQGVEGKVLPRFLIFRYNCWEYDYYEEPLVAIVASILDQFDEKVALLPQDIRERIVAALKVIGKGLIKKTAEIVGEKTGVDLEEAIEALSKGGEAAKERVKESHEYDQYFDFKKVVEELQKKIASLSENQTILFIVDELDRCLPEYTIKVLERLHHLFNNIPNVQVVLSIDAGQLEHIVRQIYGEGTDAKKYLRKFIQFEIELDEGSIKEHFNERFQQYLQHFEGQDSADENDYGTFCTRILDKLDMRTRISIIDRGALVHSILCDNKQHDLSYMCMEIFLVILCDYGIDTEYSKEHFSITSVFEPSHLGRTDNKPIPAGLNNLSLDFKEDQDSNYTEGLYYRKVKTFYNSTQYSIYIGADYLPGKILGAYRAILGFDHDIYPNNNERDHQIELNSYSKDFWEILKTIC